MKQLKRKVRESSPFRNRKSIAIFMYILCFLLFFSLFFRFTWIMVKGEVNGENLHLNVERLYTRNNILQARRGSILDRNGNPIASDATTYKMVAVLTDEWSTPNRPQHIEEPQDVSQILSRHIAMGEEEIYNRLILENKQVEFGNAGSNLTYETMSSIKDELTEAGLTGITFEESRSRLYPNGTFASHTIGLAQTNDEEENQLQGVLGIEKEYDDLLSGENGWIRNQRDRFGYVIPDQEIEEVLPENGEDIKLTIDRRIQIFLESIVEEVNKEHQPEYITANLMNAKTGEILATSQRPTFNATTKEGIDQSWQNLLVEYTFEPGSTFKVMTLAASIQEGTFRPNDYYKSGQIKVGGGTVRDVRREGWGTISHLEGLARSSNVSFVHQVEEMGHDTWKTYLDNFGFGTRTGIELPSEASGSNPYEWPLQKINTSFGQGIAVTPIQMLKAFSAVTNEGTMVEPHLVMDSEQEERNESQQVISPETAAQTLNYLKETVYSENGTARGYQIEGFEIAAKTGTAQIADPDTGRYLSGTDNHIFSVVGMAPADDPELIFFVTVQQPELNTITHGSQAVQKIFNPVMKRALEYYSAEDTSVDENETVNNQMTNYIDENTHVAIEQLQESNYDHSVVGTGDRIVQQFPVQESEIDDTQRVLLLTNGAMTLPDLAGWSRNDLFKLAELTGIELTIEGEGFVTEQNLSAGSFIETGTEIVVQLSSNQ
ncbi:MAG: PASTA domain-containing protein [Alkalibacterium sp.]|nr:PASTA domain-containing protein [Alkalibacterium sp.]